MVIVMAAEATRQDVEAVVRMVRAAGGEAFVSRGTERVIIGLVGDVELFASLDLQAMRRVRKVIRISAKYKLVSREHRPERSVVDVGGVSIGPHTVTLIAGPCAVETPEQTLAAARMAQTAGATLLRGGAHDVDLVAEHADMLQIGTRNMQNFPLLQAVGALGKPVMLKRGMNATIEEWLMAAEYIAQRGNLDIVLCERGIRTFETATRNTLDLSAVPVVQQLSHLPIIIDPSHSGGRRDLVLPLSRAGVVVGADGVIVDVHPRPEIALCDGPQALIEEDLQQLGAAIGALTAYMGRRSTVRPSVLAA